MPPKCQNMRKKMQYAHFAKICKNSAKCQIRGNRIFAFFWHAYLDSRQLLSPIFCKLLNAVLQCHSYPVLDIIHPTGWLLSTQVYFTKCSALLWITEKHSKVATQRTTKNRHYSTGLEGKIQEFSSPILEFSRCFRS